MKLLNTICRLICLATGFCLLTAMTGCASHAPRPAATAPSPARPTLARVNSANLDNRFVVVEFTSGTMPAVGTRLKLYRENKPVGTVQITEPTRGRFVTADILDGEPRVGDEIR